MISFKEKVLQIVREIEIGKVMTYKDVAIRAHGFVLQAVGRSAARAVGTIMKNNYDVTVPCHRVVRSDWHIGDYNRGGKNKKIELLESEGVNILNGKVLNGEVNIYKSNTVL